MHLNTSTGGTPSFSPTLITGYSVSGAILGGALNTPDQQQYGKLRHFDFNGDGRDDLVLLVVSGTYPNFQASLYELLSTGTAFNATLISTNYGTYSIQAPTAYFTNWNDDACTDYMTSGALYVSACNGDIAKTYIVGSVVAAMDWDGDGRTDLVVANGSTLGIYLSTASGISSLVPTSIPYSSTCQYVTMDTTGRGLDDLGCWVTNGALTYYPHNGPKPDLATKFTDGYGNSASPSYVPLSDPAGDYGKGSSQVYPQQDYIGPLYVVPSYTASDGIGGTYTIRYFYSSAIVNLQGRGFEGFGQIRTDDSRNGTHDYRYSSTTFPTTGMMVHEVLTQANYTTVIKNIWPHYSTLTLDGTANNQRYFPYYDTMKVQWYEVGGTEDGQLTETTATTYGSLDSYGNFAKVETTLTDNDSASPYYNSQWTSTTNTTTTVDPGRNWCLNMPSEVDVTNTAPGVPAITRHTSFTPDYGYCRETQKTIESSSATYKVVEDFGYDGFGNLHTDTVTGAAMTASPATRTTTINWTANGQFPQTIQNPLSQSITVGFDPNTGMKTSQTDPNYTSANPLTTTWHYDNFARKTQETRPDGTYTVWSYNDCASWGGCLFGSHAMSLAHYIYNTDGSIQNEGTTYFDQVDRPLLASTMTLSGGSDRNEVRYDNLGRVARQAMPCTWTWVGATCPYWTTNHYDLLNRLTSSQRPISATNGNLQTTTIQYAGRTATVTDPPTTADPQGRITTKIYLVTGSLARTQDHTGYYINFTYDAFGAPLSVTDRLSNTLNTMTYDYGIQAFQRSSNDADLGSRASTYDALGELTSYSDAKGQHFSLLYDALSRPTNRTEPDLTTVWTWGNSASNFNIGKLQSVTATSSAGTYTESYGYDSKARPSTKQIAIPGDGTYIYTSTYNGTTGLLDTLQYPVSTPGNQLKLQYAHQNGILKQISDAATGTHYWTANALNSRGQLTQETLGNNVVVNHSFDAVTGWVSGIQAGVGGGAALQNNSYLFDEVGNLTQRQDSNAGVTENVYPDSLYRLDHTVGDSSTQMTYDAMGRIATWEAYGNTKNVNDYSTPQPGCSYYANSQLHAVRKGTQGSGSSSFCYDANGNMTSSSYQGSATRSITWTSYNQPDLITGGWPTIGSSTSSSQFFYDQNHQRYKQIASYSGSPETTYYVGGLLEKMINSSGTAYRHYIPAGNNTVVYTRLLSGTNSTYYITKDHLGSTAVITDSTGASLVKEKFSALGWSENTTTEEATIAKVTRHEFTGHEGLDNAGVWMVNMNGRIYVPSGSMFLSPDPTIPEPGNTQSYNRYSYVNNNPLSQTDPTGFTNQSTNQSTDQSTDPNSHCTTTSQNGHPISISCPGPASDPGTNIPSWVYDSYNFGDPPAGWAPCPTCNPINVNVDSSGNIAPNSYTKNGSGQSATSAQSPVDTGPSADGTPAIVVTGHYMDAPNSSPAPTSFNYAPIFSSRQFTQYAPAMNLLGKGFIFEIGAVVALPTVLATSVPASGSVAAACTICMLNVGADATNFAVDAAETMGGEIPIETTNVGSGLKTALEYAEEALSGAWRYIQTISGP